MKHFSKNNIFHSFFRMTAVVLTACLLVLTMQVSVLAADTGTCGSDIKWSYENGVLTISGSGTMNNFEESTMSPWNAYKDEIRVVEIADGITSIGTLAFYECTAIESITLPDSIITIGEMAFAGCTNLKRVTLSNGLVVIGDHAFSRCESLSSIRFPEGLLRIGYQAFYECSSLVSIRIPAATQHLGEAIFAYCTSLTQAVIESRISKLPEWTFYRCTSLVNVSMPLSMTEIGEYAFYKCDSLDTVYHDGIEDSRDTVSEQIKNDLPNFGGVTEGDSDSIGSTTTGSTTTDSNGTTVDTNKEVVNTDDSTVEIEVNHTTPSTGNDIYDITIDVTIDGDNGWDEMLDYADSYIQYPERLTDSNTTVNTVDINVNLNNGTKLPSSVLSSLAGYDANLSVSTGSNANWNIYLKDLDSSNLSGSYNLNFTLTKIENPTKAQKELIGDSDAYLVEFEDEIPFEVTVELPLGSVYAQHYATLCQKPLLKSWQTLQSVIIDRQGVASFYLSSLDKQTKYMVVIDMKGIDASDILIPDSLSDDYGGLTDAEGNKYVLSGTESSWGLSFAQVTLILIAVIVILFVVVGLVVRLQFKSKANKEMLERMRKE